MAAPKLPPADDGAIAERVNAVYYPNWRVYRQQPPSSLRLGFVSHVFYAFAWPKEDGTIALSDEWADLQMEVDGVHGCIKALQQLKQAHEHLRIVLSVGGGGQGSQHFAAVAQTEFSRQTFAQSARAIVDAHGFDGIDIDWEFPEDARQGADYVALLAALRAALPRPAYLLTAALPAGEWALRNVDIGRAATSLDLLNLMTYDFAGPWTERAGHHAQLHAPRHPVADFARVSCAAAVDYLSRQGVPPARIALGVPAYGRSFLGAGRAGDAYAGHAGDEGTFDYRDLPRAGAREDVDREAAAAFCVGGDGGFVTYDNPATVAAKARFALERRLAGLFYWTACGDSSEPGRSLIETGYNTLHNL